MSQFFQDLWESIFTPGPTPTLLVATNATFAVLQLVLLALLLATFSVHFVILSTLSGGLWWAVNWFARELKAAQLREEAEQKRTAAAVAAAQQSRLDEAEDADEEDEPKDKRHKPGRRIATPPTTDSDTEVDEVPVRAAPAVPAPAPVVPAAPATSTAVEPPAELKQRRMPSAQEPASPPVALAAAPAKGHHPSGSRSGVSTEDEWEKVSESEDK